MDESTVQVLNGQLSYIMRDAESVPVDVITSCAHQVRRLDLSDNCLRSLEGLENLPKLEELILDCNSMTDSILNSLPLLPKVHTLSLNKNRLKDLEQVLLIVKQRLPMLTYLSLLGNEACPDQLTNIENDEDDYTRYRLYVVFKLPGLRFLDSTPIHEVERRNAEQKGPYLGVVRVTDEILSAVGSRESSDNPLEYQPLPQQGGSKAQHKATFGKCRYVYYGRHSEGNRFIRNNDL